MYWSAGPKGRVIEPARDMPVRYVVLAMVFILFFDTASKIANGAFKEAEQNVTVAGQNNLTGGAYSFVAEADEEVVVSAGMMVALMDDDSFLGQISSEKFWGHKRKKKSGSISAAQARDRRAADIANTPRSGVFTTRPGQGTLWGMFTGNESFFSPNRHKPSTYGGIVAGGYRTLCVRLSDGYYWPISYATSRGRFAKDTRVCNSSCTEPVRLFVYSNPHGRPEDMVDLRGRRYSDLRNAWRYREEYVGTRKCTPHPWEEASLAKHRAYGVMADRVKKYRRRKAGVGGRRKLVRVGRLRTMSSKAPDYVGGAEPTGRNSRLNDRSALKKRTSIATREDRSRGGAWSADGTKMMGLGRKIAKAKRISLVKPRRRARQKAVRRPKWAREAFGYD